MTEYIADHIQEEEFSIWAMKSKPATLKVFRPTLAVSCHYNIRRGCWQTWKRAAWAYFPEETQFLSCSATDEWGIKACVLYKMTANTIFHLGSVVNPDSGRSQGEPELWSTEWVAEH